MDSEQTRSRFTAARRRSTDLRRRLIDQPDDLGLVDLKDMSELVGGLMDASEVVTEPDLASVVAMLEERQRAILARLDALEAVPTIAAVLRRGN